MCESCAYREALSIYFALDKEKTCAYNAIYWIGGLMATKKYTDSLARWRRRKDKILQYIAAGLDMAAIGRKLGISRQRVRQIVNGK